MFKKVTSCIYTPNILRTLQQENNDRSNLDDWFCRLLFTSFNSILGNSSENNLNTYTNFKKTNYFSFINI